MASAPLESLSIQPSRRKRAALDQLSKLSVKLSDGSDYGLHKAVVPGVTVAQVRAALEAIPDPLAALVLDERQRS